MNPSNGARAERISDVGDHLGGARKDYAATARLDDGDDEPDDTTEVIPKRNVLKQRWPRPEFRQDAIAGRHPAQHAALFLVLYDNLARRPPAPWWVRLDDTFWADAYERSVDFFRHAYEAGEYRDWRSLSAAYEDVLSRRYSDPDQRKFAAYACGKATKRRLFSPFRFLPEANIRYQFLVALGWPTDVSVRDSDAYGAVQMKDKATGRTYWRACRGEGRVWHFLDSSRYSDKGTAARAAIAIYREMVAMRAPEEPKAKAKPKAAPPQRPLLSRPAERVGPDRRGGKNLTADEFREFFGFRGVEFGNWVTQPERQGYLEAAYDALMDLLELLQAEPTFASLGGRLGIAFGSRGRGLLGGAAHFEREKWIVHLTKSQGSGALAHEYGHAIDALLLVAGNAGSSCDSPIYAMAATRNAIRSHRSPRLGRGVGFPVAAALRALGEAVWATASSGFLANALDLDLGREDGYWSKPTELFARGFETWVTDTLQARGRKNEFLAFGAEEGDGSRWGARCSPYAAGLERRRLNRLFDGVFCGSWLQHVAWRPGAAQLEVRTASPSISAGAGHVVLPCPGCGGPMRRRSGSRGFFWGYSGYGASFGSCSKTLNDVDGVPAGHTVVDGLFVRVVDGG